MPLLDPTGTLFLLRSETTDIKVSMAVILL